MSRRKQTSNSGAMLDLWRPPQGAGDPVGCLATTYTFAPGLFDEQCLARFLEIDSEPNREDLAFLLERESRLGSVYAGEFSAIATIIPENAGSASDACTETPGP